ncbi:MAG: hypothetical protein HY855_26935 [Burkholderiales bacterium]|nr:hypothetical protein [Burkholderiales bacterium]
MRVQPVALSPLQALNLVLTSIDAVRNARAQWLLLASIAITGLLLAQLRRALVLESSLGAGSLALLAFGVTFYGSNAVGLMMMDDARGRPAREPRQALADALRLGHRLLGVVACVLLLFGLLLGAVGGLLWAAQLPRVGNAVLTGAVALGVPVLGLGALVMVGVVGPLAAPAVWCGLSVGAVLRLLWRELTRRLPQVVMLSAAVSLLSAAVAGLVSFIVLAGGRMLLALAAWVPGYELAPQSLMAALFGQGLRTAGAAATAPVAAAHTGAGIVFALGLVLPGVVYLRGLCAVYLAVQPPGEPADPGDAPPPADRPAAAPAPAVAPAPEQGAAAAAVQPATPGP